MSKRQLRARLRELEQAPDYASWREIAQELDRLEGLDAWREESASPLYDYRLIRERLEEMRRLRRAGDVRRLVFALHEGLHGNIGNIANPALYAVARAGTKRLIEQYVGEVARCLDYICIGDFPDFGEAEKLRFFRRTACVFGRSALMLSGGATLGMFHLGVVKALFEQAQLPSVISGASAGSIIAGMVCTRDDAQLADMFEGEHFNLNAFQRLSLRRVVADRAMMDSSRLDECLRDNVGDDSFEEAYDRTGRTLGVTVSPAEPLQQGRLLNYLTSPSVLVRSAIRASCAMPGVFAPVMLEARDYAGRTVPYAPGYRWVDGTLSADLPARRLARLHNVNHYIVSQTNPHIVPFLSEKLPSTGVLPFAKDLVGSTGRNLIKLTHKHFEAAGPFVGKAYDVVRQRYTGDINLFPRHTPAKLLRMLSNLSVDDIRRYIREGERTTWPKIERIRNQTRVSRTFEACLRLLEQQQLERARPPRRRLQAAK